MIKSKLKRIKLFFDGKKFGDEHGKRKIFKPRNIFFKGDFYIGKNSVVSVYKGGKISVGENFRVCDNTVVSSVGGEIIIGNNCQIGDLCWFTGQGGIYIGNNVLFSNKINIVANEHSYSMIDMPIYMQPEQSKPVYIGDDSWIGVNTTILSNTRIGKHCVIGANSLVKGTFEDYSVIAGNPAKIIKKFNGTSWIKTQEKTKNIDD